MFTVPDEADSASGVEPAWRKIGCPTRIRLLAPDAVSAGHRTEVHVAEICAELILCERLCDAKIGHPAKKLVHNEME